MWSYGSGMMGYGNSWGTHMLFGGIFWIIILVLFAFAVMQLVRFSGRSGRRHTGHTGALNVLGERYARGEIGRDEYTEKKRDISGAGGK